MWLPSVLSGDAPHFGRLTGVIPVVAIFIGCGATFLFHILKPQMRPLIYLLFLASTVWTYHDYFIEYGNHPDIATDFYLSDRQLGEWAGALPAGTDVYLTPTQEELATILFGLGNKRDAFRNYGGDAILFGRSNTPTVHLISADSITTRERLKPFILKEEQIQPNWFAIWVEAPPFEPIGTLSDSIAVDASISTLESGGHAIILDWKPLQPIDRSLTAFVHLIDADGTILAQQDRPPSGYPTTDWTVGEQIRDTFTLPPIDCPTCQIITGFYDPATATRLGDPLILTTEMTP